MTKKEIEAIQARINRGHIKGLDTQALIKEVERLGKEIERLKAALELSTTIGNSFTGIRLAENIASEALKDVMCDGCEFYKHGVCVVDKCPYGMER